MRAIDADAILKHPLLHTMRKGDVIKLIKDAPTVEPQRKKSVWVYLGTGYKDHNRYLDIESFICGGCYKHYERVDHRWGHNLTPPQKKFCSECGAEMDTEMIVTKNANLYNGTPGPSEYWLRPTREGLKEAAEKLGWSNDEE